MHTKDQTADLADLGWRNRWQQQLTLNELERCTPARVVGVERAHLRLASGRAEQVVGLTGEWAQATGLDRPTVGDWLLLDAAGGIARMLPRASLLARRAAGPRAERQAIAANVDTLFLVSSCNQDFNPSRIERYLALALEADCDPVLVLTKADLHPDPADLVQAAGRLRAGLVVEPVNALDPASVAPLRAWCSRGQTVALLGSSGVGKSTLLNTLLGEQVQATGGIRAADAHGRHTTTNRSLHQLPDGGLLLDSPGMRELQLTDVADGVARVFDDIAALAADCRFGDCQHHSEPGCAVQAAAAAGDLDRRRLANWRKLLREDARNTMSVAQRHQHVRRFSRMVKAANSAKDKRRS